MRCQESIRLITAPGIPGEYSQFAAKYKCFIRKTGPVRRHVIGYYPEFSVYSQRNEQLEINAGARKDEYFVEKTGALIVVLNGNRHQKNIVQTPKMRFWADWTLHSK